MFVIHSSNLLDFALFYMMISNYREKTTICSQSLENEAKSNYLPSNFIMKKLSNHQIDNLSKSLYNLIKSFRIQD